MVSNLKKHFYIFSFLLLISIILRIFSAYYFGDKTLDNEWKILFENFKNFGTIGINIYNGSEVFAGLATSDDRVLPSVFMPPLYLFLIIFLNFFFQNNFLIEALIFSQILFSIIASLFFFKLLNKFFKTNISYIGFLLFLFFPINIFSVSQISSVSLQVLLIIVFFYFIFEFIENKTKKKLIYLSIISSALLLLRGEFVVILFFSYLFLFFKNVNLKNILISLSIISILISPYVIRNLKLFNQITITKSFGFNLWKGNNLYSKSEGSEKIYNITMQEELKKVKPNNMYEINRDRIFKNEAIKNILSDPSHYFILYLQKIFSLMFYDKYSSYNNYYNFFHIIPKFLIGLTAASGMVLAVLKKNNLEYFSLIFLIHILLFSVFFILPRYGLIILPIQIILSCNFFNYIINKFGKT